jgi:hypothetical protein
MTSETNYVAADFWVANKVVEGKITSLSFLLKVEPKSFINLADYMTVKYLCYRNVIHPNVR